MNDKEIREWWELARGECEPPAEFMQIVNAYRRRKSAFTPCELTIIDLVNCSFVYDLSRRIQQKQKDKNG